MSLKELVVIFLVGLSLVASGLAISRSEDIKLAAVATLDAVDNPFISINLRQTWQGSQSMMATSSTICSFKNPFNATSTLKSLSFIITNNGIGGSQTIDVATSSTNLGTSSPAYIKKFAASTAMYPVVWGGGATTTNADLIGNAVSNNVGHSDNIIGPAEYVNFKIASGTPGTYAAYYTGRCAVEFQKL